MPRSWSVVSNIATCTLCFTAILWAQKLIIVTYHAKIMYWGCTQSCMHATNSNSVVCDMEGMNHTMSEHCLQVLSLDDLKVHGGFPGVCWP
jgi:hypothetical protein